MNIVITGGTGFVGSHLTAYLTKQGHHIYILTRSPERYQDTNQVTYVGWLKDDYEPARNLPPIQVIINLAGESLSSGRWTQERKRVILDSRIQATENVINLIDQLDVPPHVLIQASAVGFYGTSKKKTFTEETTHPGSDYLAWVVNEWEQRASKASRKGVRTVYIRLGLILGENGALPKIALPYKLMLGGNLGSGEQWMSWIHIDDVVGLINHAIHHSELAGPLNGTSPNPHRNKDFGKLVAKVLSRPHWLSVPSLALKMGLGDMSTLLLDGQYVLPKQALNHEYLFKYPELHAALQSLLVSRSC